MCTECGIDNTVYSEGSRELCKTCFVRSIRENDLGKT